MKRKIIKSGSVAVSLIIALLAYNGKVLASGNNGQSHGRIDSAYIKIETPASFAGDTLHLYVFHEFISADRSRPDESKEQLAIINKEGNALFRVPVNQTTYFTLSNEKTRENNYQKRVPLLYQYLIEPGDNITMKILWDSSYIAKKHTVNWEKHGITPIIVYRDYLKYKLQYRYLFTGRGALKYQIRADLDKMEDSLYDAPLWNRQGQLQPSIKLKAGLALIAKYKAGLRQPVYDLLRADLTGEIEQYRLRSLSFPHVTQQMRIEALSIPVNRFSTQIMYLSRTYPDFIVDLYKYKYPVSDTVSGEGAYFYLKQDFKGILRDRLLTSYLLDDHTYLTEKVLPDAVQTIKTPFYKKSVEGLLDAFKTGNAAYNFHLANDKGDIISLSDLKGKVVFVDFWYTGCENCVSYYKTIVGKAEQYFQNNADVVFVSISSDKDKERWLNSLNSGLYTERNNTNVVNLCTSGLDSEIVRRYRVFSYPFPMLLDKEGRIENTSESNLRYKGVAGLIAAIRRLL